MKLYSIDTGNFKLDGGAMFGVVPKSFWQKWMPADENNLCSWKMRCLLIEQGKRLTLVDTGMGNKQDPKWQSYYYRHGSGDLIQGIRNVGFSEDDITDVILSHLHFDHCGGAVEWNNTKTYYKTTFKNARYWTHSTHFDWAIQPNLREKATFFKENILPIQEAGQLYFIDKDAHQFEDIDFLLADGHTEKMIMPKITYQEKTLLFVADTIPSHAHIPVPYVMGYDIRPLQTMEEKQSILQKAAAQEWSLFFDHDPLYDCATVIETEKGFKVQNLHQLYEI
ncbi:MBL fold metallo-hydrolase [Flectobacillus major]|jgi:glyoxylase-like metal-dependent hydrolase (beta-lactamase superfamily II)|uniref:MBL fold metallo-hydrolase n=1 Tax=Flectobacillus major TaxID=103 RepID=UPI00040C762C|nr:MBL fold metallo-hydrolase [Flectobacillus major]